MGEGPGDRPEREAEPKRSGEREPEGSESPGGSGGPEGSPAGSAGRASGDRRRRRGSGALARFVGLLSLALAFALFLLTQTRTGRDAAAALLQGALQRAVDGEVRLGPVLRGNLLTRVVLGRFEIDGPGGEPFVALDSVLLEYDPLGFLRGQVRIRRLQAARADIHLAAGADGVWNFERIFRAVPPAEEAPPPEAEPPPDTTGAPGAPQGEEPEPEVRPSGLRVVFSDASVRDGSIELRTPWSAGVSEAERAARIAEAGRGESIWRLVPTADGEFEQVYRVESLRGRFPQILLVDPRRPVRIEMETVSGTLEAVSQPLSVNRFDGAVTFTDTIRIDLDRMITEHSDLSGSGWVVPGDPLEYEFVLAADPAGFEELQWLPVPVPATGGGPMEIELRSRGEVMLVEVSDGDVRSEGTRVRGGFTLALEDTPRFEAIDLDLRPVQLGWLDRVLDRPERIDGLVRGTVRGSGRIDALEIDADVTLEDLDGSVRPSAVVARGRVALVEPYGVRGLELRFTRFEPRWAEALGFDVDFPGRIDGVATVDQPGTGLLSFSGDIRHATPAGDLSAVTGDGVVDFEEGSVVDVRLELGPLSLAALKPFFPDLELVGSLRGPVRTRGRRADLEASADLDTPRGHLTFEGRFDLAAEEPTYDAQVEASGLALNQWVESAPQSSLGVRGRVAGQGFDPGTLEATFDLEILPSELERARIDTSLVRFRVAEGIAVVDTLVLFSDVGRLTGRGRFGLSEETTGDLELRAEVVDLSSWNRWIGEGIPGEAAAAEEEALFADLEAIAAQAEEVERIEGLAGSLDARGVLSGNFSAFSLEAEIEARAPRYQALAADSLRARLSVRDPLVRDSLHAELDALALRGPGYRADSLAVRLDKLGPGPADVTLYAERDTTLMVSAGAGVERDSSGFAADVERLEVRIGAIEASLQSPSRVAYGETGIRVGEFLLQGRLGALAANGAIPRDGSGQLEIRVRDVDLSELAHLLPLQPDLYGRLGGEITVTGTIGAPAIRGLVRIDEPGIGDARYSAVAGDFVYGDRRLALDLSLREANRALMRVDGDVRVDLTLRGVERRLLDDPFDLRLNADSLPLELLELRVRGLEEIGGRADGLVTIRGEPGSLSYGGQFTIAGGQAWVPDLGVRYRNAAGRADFDGSQARIDSVVVESELGGSGLLRGTIDIASPSNPGFDLELDLRRLRPIDRRDMVVMIEGRGSLRGSYEAPLLGGRYRIREGDIRQEEFLRARTVVDLTDPAIYGLLDTLAITDRGLLQSFQNPFMDNLRVEATFDLGPNLWLRSDVLDVEMVGQGLAVRMDRARDSLIVVGVVELPRGTYRFDRLPPYRQSLRITGGTIQFVGNPDFNPNLAITAEYRTRTPEGPVLIEVLIGGTLQNTQLTLTSNPPMSDSDRVCFLAVGSPCVGVADTGLRDRLWQESVLGTLSSSLSSALVGSTGLSYFNLTSVGGSGAGTTGLEGSESLFDRTSLEFGWYAGGEVFFSVSQPLGGGIPRATVEWRFMENWTLEARAESRFDQARYGLFRGTNIQNDQTFGLFLFREWSF